MRTNSELDGMVVVSAVSLCITKPVLSVGISAQSGENGSPNVSKTMQRRNFLVGIGSASVGGSALLGSGAFSRVESQRNVTVAVAVDHEAYLGLDKCNTPNGSYAHPDDHGHLRVLMNPDNPTIGSSPLGSGINSNSTSRFDRVFQICNNGKEAVCIHIEDDDDWPTVPVEDSVEHGGERRVEFYLEANSESSIVGAENAFQIAVGECVCIGIETLSYGLSAGDEPLGGLDNEIRIVADVDCQKEDIPEVPPEDCTECGPGGDGTRLEQLAFVNNGPSKDVRIEDRGPSGNHIDLLDGTVDTGEEFTVFPRLTGTPNLRFYVDGDLVPIRHPEDDVDSDDFHVSCSKTVEVGQTLHPTDVPGSEMEIVAGVNRDGDPVC
jgi:hypothetical protein